MASKAEIDIVVIVISYMKPHLVREFAASSAGLERADRVLTLVVDNGATKATRAALEGLVQPGVFEILFEEKNWGYFGGAQRGLEWIESNGLKPQWVIISNSDIEFPQRDLWTKLLEYPRTERLGVIAPRVSSGLSGSDQNPFFETRPSVERMQFYKRVFASYWTGVGYKYLGLFKDLLKGKTGRGRRHSFTKRVVYAPHGSFIIFAREYFARGGDFKHGAFLFNEEFTVAENCRERGLDVIYDPSLVVQHEEHATMGNRPSRAVMGFHAEASRFTADRYFPPQS